MDDELFPQPLLAVLAAEPGQTAFEHGERRVSYGELLALVRRLVGGLRDAGIGPGSCLAVHTGLTVEAFAAHTAAHALGCTVVVVRPGWSPAQLAGVLAGGIDAVLVDPSTRTPDVVAAVDARSAILGLDDLLEGDPDHAEVDVDPEAVARVTFTSGSTGRPKGCTYTYRTLSLTYRPGRRSADLARLVSHFDRYLTYRSWAIPVRLIFSGRSLLNRGTVVVREDDPDAVMADAIERHRITAAVMHVPGLTRFLAQLRDEPRDTSSLRALVVTGSPASPALLAAAVDQLGPIVWQGYGQAESGMISLLTPDDIAQHRDAALVSVGRPLPDVEVSIREGEVCVRSPHVMAGYWNADAHLTREVVGDDGWLHTRDLGHVDAGGRLCLTGRSRDVIMVNAEVCYAGAIERVLAAHPDVEQAFVVGVPDEATGEAIHAFLLLAAGAEPPDRPELEALVRGRLTPGHVPATTTVLDDVPVTAAGKPDKQALASRTL